MFSGGDMNNLDAFEIFLLLTITSLVSMLIAIGAESKFSEFADHKLLERGVIEYNVNTGELQYTE